MKKVTTFCDICGEEIQVLAPISIKGKLSGIHYNYKDVCNKCEPKILTTVFQIQADAKFDPDKMVKGWKQYLEKDCKARNSSTAENCVHFMEELGCHKCIERFQPKKLKTK